MSKSRRKVTVDAVADDRKKPSVFERLGPGAVKRQVGKYEDSDSDEFVQQRCRHWDSGGTCPYGNKCKFLHEPRKGSREDSDLRLRVKPRKGKTSKHSDSEDSADFGRSHGKKEKHSAAPRSTIVLKKGKGSDTESGNQWSGDELDFKEKLELERRRQQLQRALSQLEDDDVSAISRENFRIEKKLARMASSSDSDSSSRSRSRGRKLGKKKKSKRGKHSKSPVKTKAQRGSSLDSDEPQRKHKKKSKKKHAHDSYSDLEGSPEPEQKGRALLSPLKFKKTKNVIAKNVNTAAFNSDDEDEESAQPPRMNLTMPSRSPPLGITIPSLPSRQRSRSPSSEEVRGRDRVKSKRSISPLTPSKKKKDRSKVSPEYSKEHKYEKGKGSKRRSKSRSPSPLRSMSFSPDGKKVKKAEKKKKHKKVDSYEKSKDSSFERSRGRDASPVSDYRDVSPPTQEVVKKKKDKKKDKKKKDRDLSLEREESEKKGRKEKLKERDRSESPGARRPDKRSMDKGSKRDVDRRSRSPASRRVSRSPYQERRARSPEPLPRERDREFRDRDARDPRETRDRGVDPRDSRSDLRDPREGRADPRDRSRDARPDPRDNRDARDSRDLRSDPRDARDSRDNRDGRDTRDGRDNRESRDPRDIRDARDRDLPPPRPDPRDRDRDRDLRDRGDPRDSRPDVRDARDRDMNRDREGRDDPRDSREGRDTRDLRDRPFERDLPPVARDPRDLSGDRRDRYPDDRFRDEPRRDRYDDSRYAPPPGAPVTYDDRGPPPQSTLPPPRYGRNDPRDPAPYPSDVPDRGPYGRDLPRDLPGDRGRDLPPLDRRDLPGDRREPLDMPPYDRYGPNRGDSRYEGPMRGRPPYDYREAGPGWDRGGPDRGRGRRGNWRGQPQDRGGRYDDRSRRGDWENQRRPGDDFYGPDRRDWADRKDGDRRDEKRDVPRDDSRDRRDDKASDSDRDRDRDKDAREARDKDSSREDRKPARSEDGSRMDDRDVEDRRRDVDPADVDRKQGDDTESRERQRDEKDRDKTDKLDKDRPSRDEKDRKKEERDREKDVKDRVRDDRDRGKEEKERERFKDKDRESRDKDRDNKLDRDRENRDRDRENRDVRDKDRRDDDRRDGRGRDKEGSNSSKSRDGDRDRRRDDERKREESTDRGSRKRKQSRSKSRSPSVKKHRDASPTLSTHSKRSAQPQTTDKDKDDDKHSDRGSVAGSERSRKTDRSRKSRRDEDKQSEKRSHKGSDTGDRKRSRSRSDSGSSSGKRRRLDSFPEGQLLGGFVIKDAVGSDREDHNLENIEQNFSDWSDNDSDDDILNRPGESPSKRERGDAGRRSTSPAGSVGSRHSSKTKNKDDKPEEEASGKKSPEGSEDPDELESISSDEGSLVEQVKQAAVDALEIDWSSLVKDSRPKPSSGSALNRFKPGAIFAQIGISRQYAGEALYREVLDTCQRHEEQEEKELQGDEAKPTSETKIDAEQLENPSEETSGENKDTSAIETSVKTAADTESKEVKSMTGQGKFEFLSDVAMFHSSAMQRLKERRELMGNIGPFRRALCARRDLEMRRQLCRVDKNLDASQLYTSQEMDTELLRQNIELYKQARQKQLQSVSV